jgi:hypothetical protein
MRVVEISKLLGFDTVRAFDKGDKYIGRERVGLGADGKNIIREVERTRPFTVWHLLTSHFVSSEQVDEHASVLLEKLEPATKAIQQLIESPNCEIGVSIWYMEGAGFSMKAALMARLVNLCEYITVTCWDDENESPDLEGKHEEKGSGSGSGILGNREDM